MAEITLSINHRSYQVSCDDGHEDHLRRLAAYVDRRVGELVQAVGQVGEPRLLVMASLLIADELHEALKRVKGLSDADDGLAALEEQEAEVAAALEACAQRLEGIAERLASA